MEVGQVVALLSGAGIGATLSAILVFINTSKKNKLDFITKERSEWRKEIQIILDNLSKVGKRSEAIQRLKSRINPYGKNLTAEDEASFYLHDGHIWRLIEKIDISNTKQVEELADYVRLLLKYDWERSKYEINYDIFNSLVSFILVVGFLSNLLLIFFKIDSVVYIISLTIFNVVMLLAIFFSLYKKNLKNMLLDIVFKVIICFSMGESLVIGILEWLTTYGVIGWKNLSVGLLLGILISCIEVKLIFYANLREEKYIDFLREFADKEEKIKEYLAQ